LPGSDSVSVFVKEGEVAFFTESDPGLKLIAGQQGLYVKSRKEFSLVETGDENPAAYADKEFRFTDAPLRKVLRRINEVYYRQLVLSDSHLENCRITVSFKDDDIETIASIIAETMGWDLASDGEKFILSGQSCE
jgi:ferric-dicitrate binding protein FerR (iron transport regulator)